MAKCSPHEVPGFSSGTVSVAACFHTCAVVSTGSVYCWGDNSYGQLGDGNTNSSLFAVLASPLPTAFTSIATGRYHTGALTSARAVFCLGANRTGQLGDGTIINRYLTSAVVSGLTADVTEISSGNYHTCASTSSGALYCWGGNEYGEVGVRTTSITSPVKLFSSDIIAFAAGGSHTCALVFCWGRNEYGAIGDGDGSIISEKLVPGNSVWLPTLQTISRTTEQSSSQPSLEHSIQQNNQTLNLALSHLQDPSANRHKLLLSELRNQAGSLVDSRVLFLAFIRLSNQLSNQTRRVIHLTKQT
jgi:hypothetical protein